MEGKKGKTSERNKVLEYKKAGVTEGFGTKRDAEEDEEEGGGNKMRFSTVELGRSTVALGLSIVELNQVVELTGERIREIEDRMEDVVVPGD